MTSHIARSTIVVLLTALAATRAAPQRSEKTHPAVVAITGVTVIDGRGGAPMPDMTVEITGGRISALLTSAERSPVKGARIVDGRGRYLIPGLWDMHVHIGSKELFLPLFIANGVTSVRDMGGNLERLEAGNLSVRFELLDQWRKEIAAGKLIGPRITAGGPFVDGPKPSWPGSMPVATGEDGRRAVNTLKKRGVDFVKVYGGIPPDAYYALAEETKKVGLSFAGHVPGQIPAARASDAGQKSMEHLNGVLLACSGQEEEIRKEFRTPPANTQGLTDANIFSRYRLPRMLETYREPKAAALFERFVKNGTWQVPTLSVHYANAFIGELSKGDDPRLKYVPASMMKKWNPKDDDRLRDRAPEDTAARHKALEKYFEMVGAMHRAGVGILAGSDAANYYILPGFSLHHELELLVKAGLTPLQVLASATREPARYFDKLDSLGTIEVGKIADMVLLDADPSTDIANTKRIAAVITGGRVHAKDALEKLLQQAEAAVRKMDSGPTSADQVH